MQRVDSSEDRRNWYTIPTNFIYPAEKPWNWDVSRSSKPLVFKSLGDCVDDNRNNIDQLTKLVDQLQNQVAELQTAVLYAPGGDIFREAQEQFLSQVQIQQEQKSSDSEDLFASK